MAGGALRRINEPVPAQVWLGSDGRPERVAWRAARGASRGRAGRVAQRVERVERVLETWYVDDAWWTDAPVRRIYHEVQLDGGVHLVLSWDLVTRQWLAQR